MHLAELRLLRSLRYVPYVSSVIYVELRYVRYVPCVAYVACVALGGNPALLVEVRIWNTKCDANCATNSNDLDCLKYFVNFISALVSSVDVDFIALVC